MSIRNGKIAKLPIEIREELNNRLLAEEPGSQLVAWLNQQPEVIAVLGAQFQGRPISEQNLSEWRNGGYLAWLAVCDCADDAGALTEGAEYLAAAGVSAERLLLVITAKYAEVIQNWETTPEIQFNRKRLVLKDLTNAALSLRQAECTARKRVMTRRGMDCAEAPLHFRGALTPWKPELQFQAARLKLDSERLELLRDKQRNKSASSSASPASSSSDDAPASAPSCAAPSSPSMPSDHSAKLEASAPSESRHSPIPDSPGGDDVSMQSLGSSFTASPQTPVGNHPRTPILATTISPDPIAVTATHAKPSTQTGTPSTASSRNPFGLL